MKKIILIILIVLIGIFSYRCGQDATTERDKLFQVSTINALMLGSFDGQMTFGELKNKGDFGIGTFDALDGEMIYIDKVFYQVTSDGKVTKVNDNQTTPFSAVTYFEEDSKISSIAFKNIEGLQKKLNALIVNKNLFYVFKANGTFSNVKVRSVPKQSKPYPLLEDVVKNQSVFEYKKIKGDLLIFWCPAYVEGVNVSGYHIHFINDDRTKGGHVLDVSADNISVSADQTPEFQMNLPENKEFGNLELAKDKSEELEKVEK